MNLSVFEIFKVGIGPSSSHTMGPMNAARKFALSLDEGKILEKVEKINVTLYGSLALTKNGHGTVFAIQLGFEGYAPESIDSSKIEAYIDEITSTKAINLLKKKKIRFTREENFNCNYKDLLPYHTNGMTFTAYDRDGKVLHTNNYYSIGGGFIVSEDEINQKQKNKEGLDSSKKQVAFLYKNMDELLRICKSKKKKIWEIILENEKTWLTSEEIDIKVQKLINVAKNSISSSLKRKDEIKGGLNLERRAVQISERIKKTKKNKDPLIALDLINMWGIAAAEENASYGTILTAPTNGASGVIPAVIKYYDEFIKKDDFEGLKRFILTAGAIGILCKTNASISGAESGCQAEIGSACAMAAAGLTAALNGTDLQVENSAVIGLSHNLGLTCDPVKGLVQVPCIERNGINAVKAVASSRLAMLEEKSVYLTLDEVIEAMRQTGQDMHCKYKETSLGGLAVTALKGATKGDVDMEKTFCKKCMCAN